MPAKQNMWSVDRDSKQISKNRSLIIRLLESLDETLGDLHTFLEDKMIAFSEQNDIHKDPIMEALESTFKFDTYNRPC